MRTGRRLSSNPLLSHGWSRNGIYDANRKIKPHRKVGFGKLPGIAEELSPWLKTGEPVVVHFKLKHGKNESYRPINDFGLRNRANQLLVKRVLAVQANLKPWQFVLNGGRPAAMQAVIKNLAEGYVWSVEIDIANCFQSFDEASIIKLMPLPEGISSNVLLTKSLCVVPGNPGQSPNFC